MTIDKEAEDGHLCQTLGIDEGSLYRLRRGDYFSRLEQTVEFTYNSGGRSDRKNLQLVNYPLLKATTGLSGNQIFRVLRKRYEGEKAREER